MLNDRSEAPPPAFLTLGDAKGVPVVTHHALLSALEALALLPPGAIAMLSRGSRHYVRASRRDFGYWRAESRRGGWWTRQSFSAEMTSAYNERQVQESRAAGSLRKRFALMIASLPPEHQLDTDQVRTIFSEFFLSRRFTIPHSGG